MVVGNPGFARWAHIGSPLQGSRVTPVLEVSRWKQDGKGKKMWVIDRVPPEPHKHAAQADS